MKMWKKFLITLLALMLITTIAFIFYGMYLKNNKGYTELEKAPNIQPEIVLASL